VTPRSATVAAPRQVAVARPAAGEVRLAVDRRTLQRWLSRKKKRPVDISDWSGHRDGPVSVFVAPGGRRAYAVKGQCIAGADGTRWSVARAVRMVAP